MADRQAQQLDRAQRLLAEVQRAGLAAITTSRSPDAAFRMANELLTAVRALAEVMAQARTDAAIRLRDAESLSLRDLARRADMSAPSAAKMLARKGGGDE